MTADHELPFPGNRTLAGWWRQFSPLRPKALWVAHLPLQTLELTAETARLAPLDRQTRILLEAVAGCGESRSRLESRLCLPNSFLEQLLEPTTRSRLIEVPAHDSVRLTAAGSAALRDNRFAAIELKRESFSLLDLEPTKRVEFVRFTPQLRRLPPWPDSVPPDKLLRPEAIRTFLIAGMREKEELGFPLDVIDLPEAGEPSKLPVHRTERLTVSIFAVPQGSGEVRLQLYPVRPDTWDLPTLDPLLVLYPEDIPPCSEAEWHSAWIEWCRGRNVLTDATRNALLNLEENQLRVRFTEPLLATASRQFEEWVKGDLWLLAGSETVRQAAALRIDLGKVSVN